MKNYPVCNAVNCYFSNEYMIGADYEFSVENTSECKYCALNYDNLIKLKKSIDSELKNPAHTMRKNNGFFNYKLFFTLSGVGIFMCVVILKFLH